MEQPFVVIGSRCNGVTDTVCALRQVWVVGARKAGERAEVLRVQASKKYQENLHVRGS